jgi:hypothetical protein
MEFPIIAGFEIMSVAGPLLPELTKLSGYMNGVFCQSFATLERQVEANATNGSPTANKNTRAHAVL